MIKLKYFYVFTIKNDFSKEIYSPVPNCRGNLITVVGLQNLAKPLKGRVSCLGQILIKVVLNKVKWMVKFIQKGNLNLTPTIRCTGEYAKKLFNQFHATGLFRKSQKASCFLMLSGGIERDQWHKMS